MTTDERIIKYFQNELSQREKNEFEMDLNYSIELRKEFEKYLRVKEETDEIKKLKLNPLYRDSILPEFRNKLEAPKTFSAKRNLGYAFGIMTLFIISIMILKSFFTSNTQLADLQEFTQSLNEKQSIALLEELNGDMYDYELLSENISETELTNMTEAGFEIENDVAEAYNISYTELIERLSNDEVENIYNEILNRNF